MKCRGLIALLIWGQSVAAADLGTWGDLWPVKDFALQCGRCLTFHPGHLRRIIAVDEIQRLAERHILQRVHHLTLTGKHPPFVIPDIRSQSDGWV